MYRGQPGPRLLTLDSQTFGPRPLHWRDRRMQRSNRLFSPSLACAALALTAAAAVSLAGARGARAAGASPSAGGASAARPATQRLVLTYYHYSFQGDPRKQV